MDFTENWFKPLAPVDLTGMPAHIHCTVPRCMRSLYTSEEQATGQCEHCAAGKPARFAEAATEPAATVVGHIDGKPVFLRQKTGRILPLLLEVDNGGILKIRDTDGLLLQVDVDGTILVRSASGYLSAVAQSVYLGNRLRQCVEKAGP